MAETGDEARLIADGFERVYVESEGHGGPRAGLGDIGGGPHYFQGDDWDDTDEADAYRVWPANDARRLVGEVRFGAGARYRAEGPDYRFRWRPAG
ncbi:hypothetical protein [Streptomyces omiyaensis]|uniref:hypothetical protein n=1 Tax=Streptomyces omiyaensis TaxID=68247 RepID=UPI0036F4C4BB